MLTATWCYNRGLRNQPMLTTFVAVNIDVLLWHTRINVK